MTAALTAVQVPTDLTSYSLMYVGVYGVNVGSHFYFHGGGQLTIQKGDLRLELSRGFANVAGFASMAHAGDVVQVFHQRLIPFWLNVGVLIDNGESRLCASMPALFRKGLIRQLETAGYQVEVHRTWIFRGLQRSR